MSPQYGYKQNKIKDVTSIQLFGTHYYTYKNIHFLLKCARASEYLVVCFNGAYTPNICGQVMFRGFEYNIPKTDILCVSDGLMTTYKNLLLSWYVSTEKHDYNSTYISIFEHIIKAHGKYKDVIFTGTSGGGFPSIYFASHFKQTAIVGNTQFYIDKYSYYRKLTYIIETENKDKVILPNIEEMVVKSPPKKMVVYNNKDDEQLQISPNSSYPPFVHFLQSNNLSHILNLHVFNNSILEHATQKYHHLHFPNNKKHITILTEYIKTLSR